MTRAVPLNWLDLLNAQTTWSSRKDLQNFVDEALHSVPEKSSSDSTQFCDESTEISVCTEISDESAEAINDAAVYMRYQLAALHFETPLNLEWANERLSKCTFKVFSENSLNCRLPALRAIASDASENAIVKSFIDTFMLQFVHYVSSVIEGAPLYTISRCEGLHKKAQLTECKDYYLTHSELEAQWLEELAHSNAEVSTQLMEVARCADFFLQKGHGKFCCDSCRFSTFAVRKQVSDPSYHAEKQKRYRSKTKE